jgi:preprotein translocase subunit SecG
MLSVIIAILSVLMVIVSVLLILIVLMQRPKQEGLGAAFGGGMMDSIAGAHTTDVLQKGTVWLASVFLCSAVLLAVLNTRELQAKDPGELLPSDPPAEAGFPLDEPSISGLPTPPVEAPVPVPTPAPADPAKAPETPAPAPADPAKAPETPAPAPAEPAKAPEAPAPAPAPAESAKAPEAPAPAPAPAESAKAPEAPAPAGGQPPVQ